VSSSTSSSKQTAFAVWVLLILAFAWCAVTFAPWGGVVMSQRSYIDLAGELGSDTDYLIVGDSKAGPFATDCLIPWLDTHRGAVFTADSVTPVFHWYTLREIRTLFPEFRPKVVFIFVGANNLNANGLHARRDFTFFNQVALSDAWDLSGSRGERLLFAEVVLARLFPAYGHRVQITHLQVGNRAGRSCPTITESSYVHEGPFEFVFEPRNPVNDRNYYDIYRRSAYADYESSVAEASALEELIRLVKNFGGVPILVLPPVTSEIWSLEQELVGEKFDDTIESIVEKSGVALLDLRAITRFEFRDVNHLSHRGAYDVTQEYLRPLLERQP
jgi:hypothetical protein